MGNFVRFDCLSIARATSSFACGRIGGGLQIIPTSCSSRPFMQTRYHTVRMRSIHTLGQLRSRIMAPFISNEKKLREEGLPIPINPSNDNMRRPFSSTENAGPVETEFLIVGAGPAGASLACFLTSYGKLAILEWSLQN